MKGKILGYVTLAAGMAAPGYAQSQAVAKTDTLILEHAPNTVCEAVAKVPGVGFKTKTTNVTSAIGGSCYGAKNKSDLAKLMKTETFPPTVDSVVAQAARNKVDLVKGLQPGQKILVYFGSNSVGGYNKPTETATQDTNYVNTPAPNDSVVIGLDSLVGNDSAKAPVDTAAMREANKKSIEYQKKNEKLIEGPLPKTTVGEICEAKGLVAKTWCGKLTKRRGFENDASVLYNGKVYQVDNHKEGDDKKLLKVRIKENSDKAKLIRKLANQ